MPRRAPSSKSRHRATTTTTTTTTTTDSARGHSQSEARRVSWDDAWLCFYCQRTAEGHVWNGMQRCGRCCNNRFPAYEDYEMWQSAVDAYRAYTRGK